MNRIYFVMPACDEEETIEEVVLQWHSVVERCGSDCRLVVANDGSTDDTLAILRRLLSRCDQLEILSTPNSGHGATVLSLYRYAIEHGAEYVFQTDSDGQTVPSEFWQMYDNRSCYDFQIGTRVSRHDGAGRVFVSKILRLAVWITFHIWVPDANTPFRLMRADKLNAILKVIPCKCFLCNVVVSAIAVRWNYRIRWCPITFRPRQGGANSINMRRIFKIGVKALGDFWMISRGLRQRGRHDC